MADREWDGKAATMAPGSAMSAARATRAVLTTTDPAMADHAMAIRVVIADHATPAVTTDRDRVMTEWVRNDPTTATADRAVRDQTAPIMTAMVELGRAENGELLMMNRSSTGKPVVPVPHRRWCGSPTSQSGRTDHGGPADADK